MAVNGMRLSLEMWQKSVAKQLEERKALFEELKEQQKTADTSSPDYIANRGYMHMVERDVLWLDDIKKHLDNILKGAAK